MAIVIPAGPQVMPDMGSAFAEAGRGAASVQARREGHRELQQALSGLTTTAAQGLLEVFRMHEERDRYQQEQQFRHQQLDAAERHRREERQHAMEMEQMRQEGRIELADHNAELLHQRQVRAMESMRSQMPAPQQIAMRMQELDSERQAVQRAYEDGSLDFDEWSGAMGDVERRRTEAQNELEEYQSQQFAMARENAEAMLPFFQHVYDLPDDALLNALMMMELFPERSGMIEKALQSRATTQQAQAQNAGDGFGAAVTAFSSVADIHEYARAESARAAKENHKIISSLINDRQNAAMLEGGDTSVHDRQIARLEAELRPGYFVVQGMEMQAKALELEAMSDPDSFGQAAAEAQVRLQNARRIYEFEDAPVTSEPTRDGGMPDEGVRERRVESAAVQEVQRRNFAEALFEIHEREQGRVDLALRQAGAARGDIQMQPQVGMASAAGFGAGFGRFDVTSRGEEPVAKAKRTLTPVVLDTFERGDTEGPVGALIEQTFDRLAVLANDHRAAEEANERIEALRGARDVMAALSQAMRLIDERADIDTVANVALQLPEPYQSRLRRSFAEASRTAWRTEGAPQAVVRAVKSLRREAASDLAEILLLSQPGAAQ